MDASARLAFNMKVLRRHDASIDDIIESASFVVMYSHHGGGWAKTGVEGPMFLYRRNSSPTYGFFVLNRNGVENFSAALTQNDDLDLTEEFIIYRPGDSEDDDIYGIWVFEEAQRVPVGEQMLKLQQLPDAPSSQALPVANAAGVASASAPAPTAPPAGQSIDLNTLFGSGSASKPAAPAPASGMALLDDLFKSAAVSSPSPQTQFAAAAPAPQQPLPTGTALLDAMFQQAASPPTAPRAAVPAQQAAPVPAAPTASGLMALLGLKAEPVAASQPASPPAAAAPQSLSLDALFGSTKPAAPQAPQGKATYTPKPNVNPSFDVNRAPSLDKLPSVPGQPQGCAWGLFDKAGVKDELGTLNYLTPGNTARAAQSEIRTGERVQLDWSMDKPSPAAIGNRQPFEHKVLDRDPKHTKGYVNDDAVSFNTQSSSQIDGFRHVGHRKMGTFYNGLKHGEFRTSPVEAVAKGQEPCLRNGIHAWCDAGGIAGRGILLDWLSWWQQQHPGQTPPSALSAHAIPLSELLACAKAQGTELKPADILFVRSGFTAWYEAASVEERKRCLDTSGGKISSIGVENSEEVKRWLWNSHFSMVAGDAVAWEVMRSEGWGQLWLHEWLLGMWGTPIGEMLDLETLSEICKRNNRWSFFVTGAPLRVPGGVATTPQMIAIF